MRKNDKRLALNKTTLVRLSNTALGYVGGGLGSRLCPSPYTDHTFDCTGSYLNCTTSCGCQWTMPY